MAFGERILRGVDHWVQRRLTPADQRESLEVDLVKQDLSGVAGSDQTVKRYQDVLGRNRLEDSREKSGESSQNPI